MISAKEASEILNQNKLSDDEWLKKAEAEISETIRKQAGHKHKIFILAKRKREGCPYAYNEIFYDEAKMKMVCRKLENSKFYIHKERYVLRISPYDILKPEYVMTWGEKIQEIWYKRRNKKEAG